MDAIESWLRAFVPLTDAAPPPTRGRPPILPGAMLWAGLLVCVLRGWSSQRALWRLLRTHGVWDFPAQPISDDAVYRRLDRDGDGPMRDLFTAVTATVLAEAVPDTTLAPFATEVVVLDETTLDPVARMLPALRGLPPRAAALLPGKVAAVFDLRRHLYRTVAMTTDPHQNERQLAPVLCAEVPSGSLILADLGYFGFAWFDDLTDAGYWWLSRLRARTSYTVVHVHYQDEVTLDALVWLGAYRADRAKHLVRLIQLTHGGQVRRYLTKVRDPALLAAAEVGPLYARRWDIEMAFKLVKRDLGLHVLWSAKPTVILTQVWAVLVIAQVALALRSRIARQAAVDLFEVSLTLLLQDLPRLGRTGTRDPVAWFVAEGRALGSIRPSRRIVWEVPVISHANLNPPPPELATEREPRYAGRRCGPHGTDRRPT
jgi:hypothetical protein